MSSPKTYIEDLLAARKVVVANHQQALLEAFATEPNIVNEVNSILHIQNRIMENWEIKSKLAAMMAQPIIIPNATVGKPYQAQLDFEKLQFAPLHTLLFTGLEAVGLAFNSETNTIEGTPTLSGDIALTLQFKIVGEPEETPLNSKSITLVVNPDPKTLWKNIPSDKEGLFGKPDEATIFAPLGDKHLVISSKRGRSHANVGSYRDDDFSYAHFADTGWSVVAVSDGAGSYPLARKGAEVCCNAVIDYFTTNANDAKIAEMEAKMESYIQVDNGNNESVFKEFKSLAIQYMYQASRHVHNTIKAFAETTSNQNPELFNNPKAKSYLDYFHATLVFVAFKKYAYGYVVLSFGVGDCPVAMVNNDDTVTMMNWLDVGEYGGGTRFITQADIFQKQDVMATRFNVKWVPDFKYLFLMTDGIYDPKFVVEANLEKNEHWAAFIADLGGDNEQRTKVDLNPNNPEIGQQLSTWMDFWSPGNHDDRTLAIIF